jgi:hypothetical protein
MVETRWEALLVLRKTSPTIYPSWIELFRSLHRRWTTLYLPSAKRLSACNAEQHHRKAPHSL